MRVQHVQHGRLASLGRHRAGPEACTGKAHGRAHRCSSSSPIASTPLVTQIVDGLRRPIVDRLLQPDALPSIRAAFAHDARRQRFTTVVEAYDRLVAQGSGWCRAQRRLLRERRRRRAERRRRPGRPATSTRAGTCAASSRTATCRRRAAAGCHDWLASRKACGAACAELAPRTITAASRRGSPLRQLESRDRPRRWPSSRSPSRRPRAADGAPARRWTWRPPPRQDGRRGAGRRTRLPT